MNQNTKDVLFERSLLAIVVIVGLVLFCINPFIVLCLWGLWLLVTAILP